MVFPIIHYPQVVLPNKNPRKDAEQCETRMLVRYVRWCFLHIFQVSNFWAFFLGVAILDNPYILFAIWDNHTYCVKFSQNPPINQASGWFPAASLRSTPPSAPPALRRFRNRRSKCRRRDISRFSKRWTWAGHGDVWVSDWMGNQHVLKHVRPNPDVASWGIKIRHGFLEHLQFPSVSKAKENNETYPTRFPLVWSTCSGQLPCRPVAYWPWQKHSWPLASLADLPMSDVEVISTACFFPRWVYPKNVHNHSIIPRWQAVSIANPLNRGTFLSKSRIRFTIDGISSICPVSRHAFLSTTHRP